MKNTLAFFLLVSCILITGNSIYAQNRSIKFEESKWADIIEKAKKENKTIFLDCYTSWCGPCKWMAANVFTDDSVADFYNANFINVGMDMEKGEGVELVKKYGVHDFPTMLYVNADGDQLYRALGKMSSQTFIENGKGALNPKNQLAVYSQKFNADPSNGSVAFTYFEMLRTISQPHNIEVEKYFSSQKEIDLTLPINWKIIYGHIYNSTSKMPDNNSLKVFKYFEKNKSVFANLHTLDSVEAVLDNVYNFEMQFAIKNKDKKELDLLKTNYRMSNTKISEKLIMYADLHYYEKVEDWNNYAITADQYIEKYASKKMYELANDANVIYEHVDDKKMLEKAEIWAQTAVKLNNNNANFNEVYGSVLYKLGKKEEAKAAVENAIVLAKKSGMDYKETQELLDKINALK